MAKLTNAQLVAELEALRISYEALEARLAEANARVDLAKAKYRELLAECEQLKDAAKKTGRAAGPRVSTWVPKAPDADTLAYRAGMDWFKGEARRTGKCELITREAAIAAGREVLAAKASAPAPAGVDVEDF